MLVSVTTLGASPGEVRRSVDQIVGYLEGDRQSRSQQVSDAPARKGSAAPDTAPLIQALSGSGGPRGYYADSAEAPGKWRGSGTEPEHFDLGRDVHPEALRRVLLGQDPWTGEQLVMANGSNGRARGKSKNPSTGERDPDELLDPKQVAKLVGVDPSYIRRLAKETAALRATQRHADAQGMPRPDTPAAYLDAAKDADGRWLIARGEAERFAESRKEAKVVLGYDITWSVPKSVSLIYAQGTDADRAAIDQAIDASVATGMAYLEREGFHVRRNGQRETATAMVAAGYRHNTNRALEPQLHEHVVIANMATNSTGQVRAVDARGLFAHATTAGYLAGAELRHQLADRLGVSWVTPHKGLADIDGIDRSTIMAMSSRRQAVLTLSEELGYATAEQRQRAALATRPGKDQSVEADELRARWCDLIADAGLTADDVARLHHTNDRTPWTSDDTTELFTHLASHRGVTEQAAIFDRRDVIQAIATRANDRLPASAIEDLADHWLGTDAVVPLNIADAHRRETFANGRTAASLAPDEQRYTTPHMLRIETRVLDLHERGQARSFGLVPAPVIEAAITAMSPDLGADQASMVRAICSSGDQFQAVVGRAGAGKTTALRAAIAAWNDAGYRTIGAAPFGDAARKLEHETGLRSSTLEGLLTRIELAGDPSTVIDANTVIVVDEASTIGNRQLDRLYRHAAEVGATVRTIGDPQQHQSVEAGGLWQHLTTRFTDRTPTLDRNRRQTGPDMAQVRLALDDYREGLIGQALQRLDADARIVTAPTWEQLLDQMATDWYVDHHRHLAGQADPSKMVAERNGDRHALNRRAQELLRQDGLLHQPVTIGDTDFHIGERVVTQARNSDLRAEGAERRDHVINGSEGTIVAITGSRSEPDVVVDFDDLGTITVPHEFITTEVGPGRGGGITPAYAVTSFKAEGQTFDAGRNLAAPGAVNTEGMYVALTRGRNDQRTYTIAPDDQLLEPPELPVIADERTALEALADSLSNPRGADLATVADPAAHTITNEATRPLADIDGRARTLAEQRIAAAAIQTPDGVTIAALGPRPPIGAHRRLWDHAVGEAAIYRARWDTDAVSIDGGVAEPVPGDSTEQWAHYDRVEQAVLAADIEHLATVPLADLATEHVALRGAQPNSPTYDHAATEQRLAEAERSLQAAQQRLRRVERPDNPLGRPTPLDRELKRRSAEQARIDVAGAQTAVARARQRLEASKGDAAGRAAVNARIATIDRAFDRRIDAAVTRPADYLTQTLGQRPRHDGDRERWNAAARTIENYRHRHLHITPENGAMGSAAGLGRAIGPKPITPAKATAWDRVTTEIDRYLAMPKAHEQVLRRGR
ncbi:MAG: MobF family relaxase [Acidimicrobiales bacterium]